MREQTIAVLPKVNINGLVSRDAVLRAIAEHDRLGPAEFLQKYGYGEPDVYWLVHNGKDYPSKAILGVAWHYQNPKDPPLKPAQFSGGKATVQRKAKALNFVVVERSAPLRTLSSELTEGEIYTRAQLGPMLGIAPSALGSGIFRRQGTASTLLFITQEKGADRTQYADRLEDETLHMEGQTLRRTDADVMNHRERGLELLVFHRPRKDAFPSYGFRYLGPFNYVSHETPRGAGPTRFVLVSDAAFGASLPPDEADDREFDLAALNDTAQRTLRSIKERRGQDRFRQELLRAYGGRCAITGCGVQHVLEAAHISPHRGPKTNHPANGLLLRADIHTLFDLHLMSLDEIANDGFRVIVAPSLRASEFGQWHGGVLRNREPGSVPISREAMAERQSRALTKRR